MSGGLVWKEFKDRRYHFIIGLAIAALSAYYITYGYKVMLPQLLQSRQDFRFNYYIWNAWIGQGLWQLSMTFAVILGASFVSQEKKYNSIGFLLTRSITRKQFILSKLFANLSLIIVVMIVSTLALLISPRQLGVSHTFEIYILSGTLFTLIVTIFTFILTAFFCILLYDGVKAVTVGIMWIIANIFLYSKGGASIIDYLLDKNLYIEKGFPYAAGGLLLLASLLLVIFMIRIFEIRDFLE